MPRKKPLGNCDSDAQSRNQKNACFSQKYFYLYHPGIVRNLLFTTFKYVQFFLANSAENAGALEATPCTPCQTAPSCCYEFDTLDKKIECAQWAKNKHAREEKMQMHKRGTTQAIWRSARACWMFWQDFDEAPLTDSQKPNYTEFLFVAAGAGPTFATPKPVQNSKHSNVVRRMLHGQNKTAPKQTMVLKIQNLFFPKRNGGIFGNGPKSIHSAQQCCELRGGRKNAKGKWKVILWKWWQQPKHMFGVSRFVGPTRWERNLIENMFREMSVNLIICDQSGNKQVDADSRWCEVWWYLNTVF